ncbi:MAG: hypothetical protein ACHQ9S_12920 [Candidatus Binatia bacterium]
MIYRKSIGGVEWTALAALAGVVGALAAVAIATMVFWEARQEAQNSRFTAGLDSLWHVEGKWESATMVDARQRAAASLLEGKPNADVDQILEFFELVATLLDRHILDEEMVWHEFYRPIVHYWTASEGYIREVQREDPATWKGSAGMVERLMAIEAHKRRKALSEITPSKGEIHDFLMGERGDSDSSECPVTARWKMIPAPAARNVRDCT